MTDFETALVAQMTRIADAFQVIAAGFIPDVPDAVPADEACTHPIDARVADFGMTDGRPDWQCACGYRSLSSSEGN